MTVRNLRLSQLSLRVALNFVTKQVIRVPNLGYYWPYPNLDFFNNKNVAPSSLGSKRCELLTPFLVVFNKLGEKMAQKGGDDRHSYMLSNTMFFRCHSLIPSCSSTRTNKPTSFTQCFIVLLLYILCNKVLKRNMIIHMLCMFS